LSTAVSPLGVVLVAYNSADVILDCLETLMSAAQEDGTQLRVVVVDNASPDDGVAAVCAWATGKVPYAPPTDLPFPHVPLLKPLPEGVPTILSASVNGGFAAGVNIGLKHLFADPVIQRVWILNPDSVVPPGTPTAFACHDPGPFALMGGRVLYYAPPNMIQIDGGTLNRQTGVTGNINQYADTSLAALPEPGALSFITGASMVASRAFWDHAGPMPEDYFLYYEEVDWALRRGPLPLAVAPGAVVHHRAGTAIGSPAVGRPASPFSLYFKHRARLRFVRRHLPRSLVGAWAYTLAKMGQFALKGWWAEADATFRGARGAAPPPAIRDKVHPSAAALAFAPAAPGGHSRSTTLS
jgi:GT2 family glycosyltransferase